MCVLLGVDALLVGPTPTPGVAFLTQNMRADAGVVISASHNPFDDNGIKIFARDGFKLPDSKETELERYMDDEGVGKVRPTKSAVGKAFRIDDAMGRYIVSLKSVVPTKPHPKASRWWWTAPTAPPTKWPPRFSMS